MSFKPIRLQNGKTLTSLSDARIMLDQIGIHERWEPHWVKAIAEINNAMADPARESAARKALYAALVIAKRAL